jgi:hypothetical protein
MYSKLSSLLRISRCALGGDTSKLESLLYTAHRNVYVSPRDMNDSLEKCDGTA